MSFFNISSPFVHIGEMLDEGIMTMTGAKICATEDSIEAIKPTADKFGMEYYAQFGLHTAIKSPTGSDDTPYNFCMIMARFTVHDWEKLAERRAYFLEKVGEETDCLFYGFYQREEATLEVREFYKDGAAVNAHLGNVGEALGQLLQDGIVALDLITAHGPEEELEIAKQTLDGLGTVYLPQMDKGFARFSTVA
jgi:hypothetical protein